MFYLYELKTDLSEEVYIGITNNLKQRLVAHRCAANNGKKSKLYDHMRKYGPSSYLMRELGKYDSWEETCDAEVQWIRDSVGNLNLAHGGEGGFVVQDKLAWQEKLSVSRAGRKPALGMTHTETNKKFFGECGKLRWDIYGRYPGCVTEIPFKDAQKKYGISKTHYYRLLKQAKVNALS